MADILLTGVSGNVGKAVVEIFIKEKKEFKVGVRTVGKQNLSGAEETLLDFEKPETFPSALRGIKKVFLVRPPQLSNPKIFLPFFLEAKKAGIKHIVFLSLIGVEKNYFVPHREIELNIKKDFDYTFLRAGFFMQNLDTTHREEIKDRNEIFIPAGNGKTSFVDVRDIAEVAYLALNNEEHKNKAYNLTGNKPLTYYEVAEILTEVLNKKVIYKNPSLLQFWKTKRKEGWDRSYTLVVSALYTTCRLGLAGKVHQDLKVVLNREPKSLIEYVINYKEKWST